MTDGDKPAVPKLKLVLQRPKSAVVESSHVSKKADEASTPSEDPIDVDDSGPATARHSLATYPLAAVVQRAIDWTWRQLDTLHDILPGMSDVERRHALAVLSRQGGELWGQVSRLTGMSPTALQEASRIIHGLTLIDAEEAATSQALQEVVYQAGALSQGFLPQQVRPMPLLAVLEGRRDMGFPFDISRFAMPAEPEASIRARMRNFLLLQASHLLKSYFANGRVVSVSDSFVTVRALEEFDLDFTVTPTAIATNNAQEGLPDVENGFMWFLLRVRAVDERLADRLGHSLTGMLQGQRLARIGSLLATYRQYCFLQSLYAQFRQQAEHIDLAVDKGPDMLKATLWGRFRTFEARLLLGKKASSPYGASLELRNIPYDSLHSSPRTTLVTELVEVAANDKLAGCISKFRIIFGHLQSPFGLSVTDDGAIVCNGTLSLHVWVDWRTGAVLSDLPRHHRRSIDDLVDEADGDGGASSLHRFVKAAIAHFNARIMESMRSAGTVALVVLPSELDRWNLSGSAIEPATFHVPNHNADQEQVAVAFRLDPQTQAPLRYLLALQQRHGLWRIEATKLAATDMDVELEEEVCRRFWLDLKAAEGGLCVNWHSGEIMNVCLRRDVCSVRLDWQSGCLLLDKAGSGTESVPFQSWREIRSLLLSHC